MAQRILRFLLLRAYFGVTMAGSSQQTLVQNARHLDRPPASRRSITRMLVCEIRTSSLRALSDYEFAMKQLLWETLLRHPSDVGAPFQSTMTNFVSMQIAEYHGRTSMFRVMSDHLMTLMFRSPRWWKASISGCVVYTGPTSSQHTTMC